MCNNNMAELGVNKEYNILKRIEYKQSPKRRKYRYSTII